MRFVESDRISFNNLPNYSYSRNTLLGLGGDITANVLALMQSRYGATIKLSSATNVTNALAPIYGLINQYGATYNVGADGKAIPFASPVTKSFGTQEYEFYMQDTLQVDAQPHRHLRRPLLQRHRCLTRGTASRESRRHR